MLINVFVLGGKYEKVVFLRWKPTKTKHYNKMKKEKTQYVGSIERESITVTILLLLAASLLLTTSCSSSSKVATSSTKPSKTAAINGHEYVDLDLPSKTLWATCNVGAKKAEEYGNFYAWGETQPKNDYSWKTYTLPYEKSAADRPVQGDNGFKDKLTFCRLTGPYSMDTETMNLLPEDDAATINWGQKWSTPTQEQWSELCDTTLCRWTQQKKGFLVTSKKNGKSIFLPACGMYNGTEAPETFLNEGDSVRYDGLYWSGTLYGKNWPGNEASCLRFNTGYQRNKLPRMSSASELYVGMSVRPVAKLPE